MPFKMNDKRVEEVKRLLRLWGKLNSLKEDNIWFIQAKEILQRALLNQVITSFTGYACNFFLNLIYFWFSVLHILFMNDYCKIHVDFQKVNAMS